MIAIKRTLKYYFSVEGETEKWYLDWLREAINGVPAATHKVSIVSKKKEPVAFAKSLSLLNKTEVTDLFDYESDDDVHSERFRRRLDGLKRASNLGKQIRFSLGYSNFTFELWIILHKVDCNTLLTHRRNYCHYINRAFDESFENLAQYKHEASFRRVLGKLSIDDVVAAIERAKAINERNEQNALVLQQYKGYRYYRENPSLSVWVTIEKILKDCHLI